MAANKPHEVKVVHLNDVETELAELLSEGWEVLSLRQHGEGEQWHAVIARPAP